MIGWGALLSLGWRMLTGRAVGGLNDVAARLGKLAVDLQESRSDVEKKEIEQEMLHLQLLHELQKPQADRWWSPMQIGQYMVVISFCGWYSAVMFVSVLRPYLVEGKIAVDDLPTHIFQLSLVLIPAILIGQGLKGRRK